MISNIMIYLPSFLTRYSGQIVSILLPYVLHIRQPFLNKIVENFVYFFIGCIVGAGIFYKWFLSASVKKFMQWTLIIQLLMVGLAFLIQSNLWLNILRFCHGIIVGVFRPVNQIWVNEFEYLENKVSLAKRASWNKCIISIGLSFGSLIGSGGMQIQNFTFLIAYLSFFLFVPLVMFFFFYQKLPEGFDSSLRSKQSAAGIDKNFFIWLKEKKILTLSFVFHILGMIAYGFWMFIIPYQIRSMSAFYDIKDASFFLAVLFPVQTTAFSVFHFFITKYLHVFKKTDFLNVTFAGGAIILQSVLLWLALMIPQNPTLTFLLLLLGASVISSFIYPMLLLVLFCQVNAPQSIQMRKVFIFLSVLSDVGQLFGSLLLKLVPSYCLGPGMLLWPAIGVLISLKLFWSAKE